MAATTPVIAAQPVLELGQELAQAQERGQGLELEREVEQAQAQAV